MKLQNRQTRSLSNKLLVLASCYATSCFAPTWEAEQPEVIEIRSAESNADLAAGAAADDKKTPLTSVQPTQSAMKPTPAKNTPLRQDLEQAKRDNAKDFLTSRDFGRLNGWMPKLGKCAPMCTRCNLGCAPCCPAGCIGWVLCNYCGTPKSTGCIYSCDERCKSNCIKAQLVFGPIQERIKLPCCGDCCETMQDCMEVACPWDMKFIDESDLFPLLMEETPAMQEMTMMS